MATGCAAEQPPAASGAREHPGHAQPVCELAAPPEMAEPDAALKMDDVLTDTLVDGLFLPFRTRKFSEVCANASLWTNDSRTSVLEIIRQKVFPGDLDGAAFDFLQRIPAVLEYVQKNLSEKVEDFCMHAKRYFSLYLPNAGFEVGQTFRYDPAKAEACLLATKDFAVGEVISLCTGTLAYVSSDQENALTGSQQDFSVMYSSKTRRMGVMTGPARFANHDCNANCKFVPAGKASVMLAVIRKFRKGEEITTFYGDHYFGNSNSECRCATCETECRGAFARQNPPAYFRTRRRTARRMLAEQVDSSSRRASKSKVKTTKCQICSATMTPGEKQVDAKAMWHCARCTRHRDIFGLRWPNRKPAKEHYDLAHWQRANHSRRIPKNLLYSAPTGAKKVNKLVKVDVNRLRRDLAGVIPGFSPSESPYESSANSVDTRQFPLNTGPAADEIVQPANSTANPPSLAAPSGERQTNQIADEGAAEFENSQSENLEPVTETDRSAHEAHKVGGFATAPGKAATSRERRCVPGRPADLETCLPAELGTTNTVEKFATLAMFEEESNRSANLAMEVTEDVGRENDTPETYGSNQEFFSKIATTTGSDVMSRTRGFDPDLNSILSRVINAGSGNAGERGICKAASTPEAPDVVSANADKSKSETRTGLNSPAVPNQRGISPLPLAFDIPSPSVAPAVFSSRAFANHVIPLEGHMSPGRTVPDVLGRRENDETAPQFPPTLSTTAFASPSPAADSGPCRPTEETEEALPRPDVPTGSFTDWTSELSYHAEYSRCICVDAVCSPCAPIVESRRSGRKRPRSLPSSPELLPQKKSRFEKSPF